MEPIFTGAIEDPRTEEEKAKDYTHEEILGMGPLVDWRSKLEAEWVKWSLRNQAQSLSCGGQAGAKADETFTGIPMSAHPIYRRRSNYPSPGMYLQEIASRLMKGYGTTTEALDPSQNIGETEMNRDVTVETPDRIAGYYFLPVSKKIDMDLIAAALEKGHAVIFGISSNYAEYTSVPVFTNQAYTFSHFVCAAPKNYLLYNGEKSVVIDESWGIATTLGNGGQRVFTESFLKERCWGCMALMPIVPVEKPHFVFTSNLREGYFGEEVKQLQQALAYLGYFPKTQEFTGYFGPLTKKGVKALQEANKQTIIIPAGFKKATGVVGSFTRGYLNLEFA